MNQLLPLTSFLTLLPWASIMYSKTTSLVSKLAFCISSSQMDLGIGGVHVRDSLFHNGMDRSFFPKYPLIFLMKHSHIL